MARKHMGKNSCKRIRFGKRPAAHMAKRRGIGHSANFLIAVLLMTLLCAGQLRLSGTALADSAFEVTSEATAVLRVLDEGAQAGSEANPAGGDTAPSDDEPALDSEQEETPDAAGNANEPSAAGEPDGTADMTDADENSDSNEDANEADATEEEPSDDAGDAPTYVHRLLVGLADGESPREEDVVLGTRNDAVLLGFQDADALTDAKSYYEQNALWCAEDSLLGLAEGEEAPEGDPVAVGSEDNALAQLAAIEEDERKSSEQESDAPEVTGDAEEQRPILVALIDTGAPVDLSMVEEEGDEKDEDEPPYLDAVVDAVSVVDSGPADAHGHATRMLQAMQQQSEDVRVLCIKALDDEGRGSASTVYAAIQYAIEHDADVINLSLSGRANEGNAAIAQAVKDALDHSVVVVGAAGNGGYDATYFTPGNVEEALTVGAAAEQGVVLGSSNRGDCVDLYVIADSTSMATAYVSGWLSTNGTSEGWYDRLLASDLNAFVETEPGEVPEDATGVSVSGNELETYSSVGQDTFVAPADGFYILEAWGASGGKSYGNKAYVSRGGYGGYTYGTTYLYKDDLVYVYVGGKGGDATNAKRVGVGGENGGGKGTVDNDGEGDNGEASGGGGGATHFAFREGLLKDLAAYRRQVVVVAGGGSGASWLTKYAGGGKVGQGQSSAGGQLYNETWFGLGRSTGNSSGNSARAGVGGGGGGWRGGIGGINKQNAATPNGGGSGRIGGASGSDTDATGGFESSDNATVLYSTGRYSDGNTTRKIGGVSIAGNVTVANGFVQPPNFHASNGYDGYARVSTADEYLVVLDSSSADTHGTTMLYGVEALGLFHDPSYTIQFWQDKNGITVPTLDGTEFLGYYTEPSGGGTKVIDEKGFLTTAFHPRDYPNNQTVVTFYAHFGRIKEITSGVDYPAGAAMNYDPAQARTTEDPYWWAPFEMVGRTFTAPRDGWYKLEAWGASGGASGKERAYPGADYLANRGGKGGYSKGWRYFSQGEVVYIYTGQWGNDSNKVNKRAASYNGGGASKSGGAGGGMTHFSQSAGKADVEYPGSWDAAAAIMVAGGGGGADFSSNGQLGSYAWGGAGGGRSGGLARRQQPGQTGGHRKGTTTYTNANTAAKQTISGSKIQGVGASSVNGNGAGGGGWWGGIAIRAQSAWYSGGGGSGYLDTSIFGGSFKAGSRRGNGQAKVTYAATLPIRLENFSPTVDSDPTEIYEIYEAGVFLTPTSDYPMTTKLNPVIIPQKTGYAFGGYYTEPDGKGKRMVSPTGYRTSAFTSTWFKDDGEEHVLYAKWTLNSYALLTDDGQHLYFFRDIPVYPNGSTQTVTLNTKSGVQTLTGTVWSNIEATRYTSAKQVPWLNKTINKKKASTTIESVEVIDEPDPLSPDNMRLWFYNCIKLTDVDITHLDTSNTTTMRSTFHNCKILQQLDLSNMDTVSSTIYMQYMFTGCAKLQYVKLGEKFSFYGKKTAVLTTLPAANSKGKYRGKWIGPSANITPIDVTAQRYTHMMLASTYDGASMTGWYQWDGGTIIPATGGTGDALRNWLIAAAVLGAAAWIVVRRRKEAGTAGGSGLLAGSRRGRAASGARHATSRNSRNRHG